MNNKMENNLMEKIVSLCKRRGFIFPGSEIYGGLAGTWDYGPLGAELKRNIKTAFWREMVESRDDVVGVDAAILMAPKVWEASGHVGAFSDPLVECKACHHRFRADSLKKNQCPDCGGVLSEPKQFNLLVEAQLGVIENAKQKVYLRGEITQGVHVNFKNVLDSTRLKIPFGIAQIGKTFRNEITPGNFTFRSREFEQMELQYYIRPDAGEAARWFKYWKEKRMEWYLSLGMSRKKLRFREHEIDERAHYAKAAWDIEYLAPFEGWKELEGIHDRGDWDLRRHQDFSGKDFSYSDDATGNKYLPRIIETSGGVDRAALFFLIDAYYEEKIEDETRIVLKLHPKLAPYKIAVFPLLANKKPLVDLAKKIYLDLKKNFMVAWDDRGNTGKRYRSQDEIGTPYCITVDFESLEKNDVTVRDRDTMKQERVSIAELKDYCADRLKF